MEPQGAYTRGERTRAIAVALCFAFCTALIALRPEMLRHLRLEYLVESRFDQALASFVLRSDP